ncbi:hypothetical protein R3P38DRAFT_3596022 [Favolaschia claudopus]|uniref:Uncharacterized protein n=1 Tax=Favolaschia claudopus TaxID=2862362 RepID=A0AAW0DP16_9AGAR
MLRHAGGLDGGRTRRRIRQTHSSVSRAPPPLTRRPLRSINRGDETSLVAATRRTAGLCDNAGDLKRSNRNKLRVLKEIEQKKGSNEPHLQWCKRENEGSDSTRSVEWIEISSRAGTVDSRSESSSDSFKGETNVDAAQDANQGGGECRSREKTISPLCHTIRGALSTVDANSEASSHSTYPRFPSAGIIEKRDFIKILLLGFHVNSVGGMRTGQEEKPRQRGYEREEGRTEEDGSERSRVIQ